MTFLQKYTFGSITFNMMLTVLCINGPYLCFFIDILFSDAQKQYKINITVDSLGQGDIAAAVILISFGAVLGRATPSQLLVMGFIEIIFYSINNYIVTELLFASDVGGSIVVHEFGCYFGLTVSYLLGTPENNTYNNSNYQSDLFAMIGTIFLWLYWPSFNGIFPNADFTDSAVFGFSQSRAFINTILSLCSCTITTLGMSYYIASPDKKHKKIDMVHIQNSTLAGGVAIGAAANLYVTPGGALIVGLVASILSVVGFKFITPFIENRLNM